MCFGVSQSNEWSDDGDVFVLSPKSSYTTMSGTNGNQQMFGDHEEYVVTG